MTRTERATHHFETHQTDFELQNPDSGVAESIYCTTKFAHELADKLANLGSTLEVVAVHPEFLGWTVAEIETHLEAN